MKPKALVVGPANLGPYHLARYKSLAEIGVDLTVLRTPVPEYYRPWKVDLSNSGFTIEQPFDGLSDSGWQTLVSFAHIYLKQKEPDTVIMVGYNRKYIWAASVACRKLGIPIILYLVGWEHERPRNRLKELAKGWYCRRFFWGALVTGVRAAAYGRKLGIPTENIWKVGNVVDNDHFEKGEAHIQLDGISTPYFLSVSRLSPEKNVARLLEAFAQYRASGGTWHLVIAGIGPEERALRASVSNTIRDSVHWPGWVNYGDLPALYGNAGCLVLPSLIEPWGLVANEAMAAGLPVIVSRRCGCLPELCWRGVNGFDFDPLSTGELTRLMLRTSGLGLRLEQMGLNSKAIIGNYSLRLWSSAVYDCLREAASRKRSASDV